jgi:cyclopropane-fatty-acyl-phospholipid synthase
LLRLAARIGEGSLDVRDLDGRIHRFGAADPDDPGLAARVTVTDERAWTAIASEGSIGLGRGYIEGWWETDDPTAVVRVMIRNLRGLDELRNRINRHAGRLGDGARRALPRPSRQRNREDIGAHYDLGNDFFRLFLDPTMTYSSAVFTEPGLDLERASLAKYDRLLAKLGLGPDHRLLEIGTGWGGLAIRAAERWGASVTTTTVSTRQLEEARARAASSPAGHRIELLGRDWRDLSGRHDRIVSIEMIEAVDWRDYDRFFATIERCLAPDGMVGLQAICVPDRRWNRTKNTEDFIRRFVFPGGFLPSIGSVIRSVARATRRPVLDVEDFSTHYAETLRRWRTRFDHHGGELDGLGLDQRFGRLWRFYLAYCEAGFLERHCTVNQIVLVGPRWRPSGLELRPW